jgi:CheY-like chemotaxis protein
VNPAPPPAAVLVVEDEFIVALGVEETLTKAGYRVLGPAPNVGAALRAIEAERPAAALVDVNLGGERSYAVADALEARGVPYAFVTGYDRPELRPQYRRRPVLVKPCDARLLLGWLRGALRELN